MRTFLAVYLAFAAGAAVAVADERRQDVEVELKLPNASVLPGVPFDLTVIYRNETSQRIAVGATANMIITPRNRPSTRLRPFAHVNRLDLAQRANFELQSGETQTGTISWDTNWFYEDAAFTIPGDYDISLELTGDKERAQEEGFVYAGTVTTASVHLTRIQPRGEDADVWALLSAAANGAWPSHGFGSRATREHMADVIVSQHPTSSYYPYALLLGHLTPSVAFEVAREAAQKFADSPAHAHLLVLAAVSADSEARQRIARGRPASEAETYFTAAVSYAKSALESGNPAVRAQATVNERVARDGLEHLRDSVARRR